MAKRVINAFTVWPDGAPVVYAGGALVDDDDPILTTHGHLFGDVDTLTIRRRGGPEQATAAPGEQRTRTTPPPPADTPPADTPPPPALYDPTADTVKGVLAYLDGVTDPDEARRVLDAEQASATPRAGILGVRDQVLARYTT